MDLSQLDKPGYVTSIEGCSINDTIKLLCVIMKSARKKTAARHFWVSEQRVVKSNVPLDAEHSFQDEIADFEMGRHFRSCGKVASLSPWYQSQFHLGDTFTSNSPLR
jgi:hypothetical protein